MTTRRRPEPLRYQIRADILELLTREKYLPGDKLPTENELMELLNVSRSTLREGLHLLEEERIIRSRQGTGRFLVSVPGDYKFDITHLQSATQMMADYGLQITTKVFTAKEEPADPYIASLLALEEGSMVMRLERVRYVENVAVICSIDVVPLGKFGESVDPSVYDGSLFNYLKDVRKFILEYSKATVRAIVSDAFIAQLGLVDTRVPWILFEQVNYDQYGEPIIYSKDYHRGDAITFRVSRYRYITSS